MGGKQYYSCFKTCLKIMILLKIILSILIAGVVHELGHFISAKIFGHTIKFKFAFGKFNVPRFVWFMPEIERWKQRIIAMAGFGLEILFSAIVLFTYPGFGTYLVFVSLLHFVTYKFYAGDVSDFNYF